MAPLAEYRPEDQESLDLLREYAADPRRINEQTLAKYVVHLEEFRVWLLHASHRNDPRGRVQLTQATARDINGFLAYLRQSDRYAAAATVRSPRALSASSRKSAYSALRSFYRFARRMRIIKENPTEEVDAPRVRITPGLVLTREELRLLLDAPSSPRVRIQTYLLAYTAARAGALRNLRWSDIDLHNRTLILHTKNDVHEAITIHPVLMNELRRWFLYQDHQAEHDEAIRLARSNPETDFVLLTRTGRQLPKNTITKQLKTRAIRLGLHLTTNARGETTSRVCAHTLRRTVATLLLNDGQPLDAVSDVLGHRQVETTRRHYAYSQHPRRRATVEAITI